MERMRNIGLGKGQLGLSVSQGIAGNPIGHAKPLGSVQFTDPLRSNTLGLPESFVVVRVG